MKKHIIAALILTAALSLSAFTGCNKSESGTSSAPERTVVNQNDLPEKEIDVSIAEEASENQTSFKLNKVIDAGAQTDDGKHYIYLNVTIGNTTGEDYELNMLNNFYLLLPDGTESHFDIRTQLYAENNFKNYTGSIINVPANGEFTGYVGGFLLSENVDRFTVGFFPTQNDDTNKESVVKCEVSKLDMTDVPPDLIG